MEYIIFYGSWALAIGAVLFAGACTVWYLDERKYSTNVLYPKMNEATIEFKKAKSLYAEMSTTARLNKYVDGELKKITSLVTLNHDTSTTEMKNLTDRVWTLEKRNAPTPLLDRAGVTTT